VVKDLEERVDKHRQFWRRANDEPLVGFSIGDYFVSRRFQAAEPFLTSPGKIEPDMLDVSAFENDYRRMLEESSGVPQDSFFTAAPFTGIPWMEAMLGCSIYSTEVSFIAKSPNLTFAELDLKHMLNQQWVDKYLEFTEKLERIDRNRLPVGQPIMRGPTDLLGTLIGQAEMVVQFFDNPQRMTMLLEQAADIFLDVIHKQKQYISPFFGGCSLGFYDLWSPGDCVWFQDDLNALLSPDIYRRYVLPIHRRLIKSYQYNLVHLHPSSFFTIDSLMEIDELKVIEINKDEEGPSVEQMLPVFHKVQKVKNCVVWGSFSRADLELLQRELDPAGLYIQITAETIEQACNLADVFA